MIALKVTGMTCEHCERAVSQALSSVTGVDRVVAVSHERAEAILEGNAAADVLIAAVREEGYETELAP